MECECRSWCGPLDRSEYGGHHPNCPHISEEQFHAVCQAAIDKNRELLRNIEATSKDDWASIELRRLDRLERHLRRIKQ